MIPKRETWGTEELEELEEDEAGGGLPMPEPINPWHESRERYPAGSYDSDLIPEDDFDEGGNL